MKGSNSYFGDMVRTERLLREHGFDHWPTEDELVRYLFATNDRLDAVCNAMNAELVWIGNTYLDGFDRISPAFLNSTGLM